jgi:hypothetical protein
LKNRFQIEKVKEKMRLERFERRLNTLKGKKEVRRPPIEEDPHFRSSQSSDRGVGTINHSLARCGERDTSIGPEKRRDLVRKMVRKF